MTRLDSRVQEHPVLASLGEVRGRIEELDTERFAEFDTTDPADTLSRVLAVCGFTETRILGANAQFVSIRALDDINGGYSNLRSSLDSLIDSNELGMVRTIDEALDVIIDRVNSSVPANLIADSEELHDAASEAALRVSGSLQTAITTANEIEGRLETARTDMAANEQSLRDSLETRSGAIEQTAQSLEANLTQIQDDANSAIAGFQAQFEQAESSRSTAAASAQSESKERLDEVFNAAKEAREAEFEAIREESKAEIERIGTNSKELVEQLTKYKEDAGKLVDLVATSSTAGAFQKEATEQKTQADRWRKIAIGFGIAAGAIALLAVFLRSSGNIDTELIVIKALAAAAFTALAGYAANQSRHHREREERAKRLELELTAFGPFQEALGDGNEEQKQVRKEYIDRIFVGSQNSDSASSEPAISESQISLVGQLFDLVRK